MEVDVATTQTFEQKVHALIDKDAIRDVIYRYCRAVDRCDRESMKACYWPDARGDRACGESYVHVPHRLARPDGTLIDNKSNCRYIDLFERRNGEWKILFRAAVADTMYDEAVVSYADLAALGPLLATAPRAVHGKGDPAYLGYDARALDKPDFAMTDFWGAVLGRQT